MSILKVIKKLTNQISKAILVVIVFFGIIALFTSIANKDKIRIDPEETTKNQRAEIYKVINDPEYQKTDAGRAAIGVYRAMMCGTIGEACTDNPADADENFNHSLFGFVSNLIVMPYANPPASGVQYIAYSMSNAGLLPKAYAAEGIGFASIKPMIEIWKAFRNVAYLILVLVLIAIGFMIMFRMKLNPQTVISLENSLPKIVISLILITFSFAIAGLLIDLMYVIISGGIYILSTTNIGELTTQNLHNLQNKYIVSGIDDLWPFNGLGNLGSKFLQGSIVTPLQVGNSIARILPLALRGFIEPFLSGITSWFIAHNILKWNVARKAVQGTTNASALGFTAGWMPGAIIALIDLITGWKWGGLGISFIFGLLFILTLIFLQFRLFFMLLSAYLKSLILILFSPIFFLFEAIPGKNAFSFWFKTLVGELLTFPLVIMLLLFGYALTQMTSTTDTFNPPFLYAIDKNAFASLLGIGMILIIPNLVKVVKELLGIKGIPPLFGPGAYFAGAGTVAGGALGLLSQYGSLSLAVPGLRRFIGGKIPFLGSPEMDAERKEALALQKQKQAHQQSQDA